jgi:hypothetical protein
VRIVCGPRETAEERVALAQPEVTADTHVENRGRARGEPVRSPGGQADGNGKQPGGSAGDHGHADPYPGFPQSSDRAAR